MQFGPKYVFTQEIVQERPYKVGIMVFAIVMLLALGLFTFVPAILMRYTMVLHVAQLQVVMPLPVSPRSSPLSSLLSSHPSSHLSSPPSSHHISPLLSPLITPLLSSSPSSHLSSSDLPTSPLPQDVEVVRHSMIECQEEETNFWREAFAGDGHEGGGRGGGGDGEGGHNSDDFSGLAEQSTASTLTSSTEGGHGHGHGHGHGQGQGHGGLTPSNSDASGMGGGASSSSSVDASEGAKSSVVVPADSAAARESASSLAGGGAGGSQHEGSVVHPGACRNPFRPVARFLDQPAMVKVSLFLIMVNFFLVVLTAVVRDGERASCSADGVAPCPMATSKNLAHLDIGFAYLFVLEVLLRGLGKPREFARSPWDIVDAVVVISYAVITTLLNAKLISAEELSALVVARVMRLARFHRFVQAMKRTEEHNTEVARQLEQHEEEEGAVALDGSHGSHGSLRDARPTTSAEVDYEVGTHVLHPTRGSGRVVEHMADGRFKVAFESGEVHRYKPASLPKLARDNGNGTAAQRSKSRREGDGARRSDEAIERGKVQGEIFCAEAGGRSLSRKKKAAAGGGHDQREIPPAQAIDSARGFGSGGSSCSSGSCGGGAGGGGSDGGGALCRTCSDGTSAAAAGGSGQGITRPLDALEA